MIMSIASIFFSTCILGKIGWVPLKDVKFSNIALKGYFAIYHPKVTSYWSVPLPWGSVTSCFFFFFFSSHARLAARITKPEAPPAPASPLPPTSLSLSACPYLLESLLLHLFSNTQSCSYRGRWVPEFITAAWSRAAGWSCRRLISPLPVVACGC